MKRRLLNIFLMLAVLPKIGIWNVVYMTYYRFSMKLGTRKRRFKQRGSVVGTFFLSVSEVKHVAHTNIDPYREFSIRKAGEIYKGEFTFYHHHKINVGTIPNWFYDPFSKLELSQESRGKHWTEINEFDLNTGDIKNLWELSRFDWVTDLARGYVMSEDEKYLTRLNALLNNWSQSNPVNNGINWRCGQETSIRVMKLFHASILMDTVKNINSVLFEFIFYHLERINGNIRYAVAQDNNHGTSEAAALYIGSLWLLNQTKDINIDETRKLTIYRKRGRKILENRLRKLILRDGTFAQKSTNYHRVVIDTMSFVMFGMRKFNDPDFSPKIYHKLENLGEWLLQMVSNNKGEVPNLGANDGAMFETLHNCSYRDYRPSLQLYYALLKNVHVWDNELLNEPLVWRGIQIKDLKSGGNRTLITTIKDREFVQLVYNDIVVRVKATQDNFRPTNDVLNLDVWYKGVNVILDTGSYSYNSDISSYFKSIKAHSTLQFGEGEPMPRISRFLNGAWINVNGDIKVQESDDEIRWQGVYVDYRRNRHQRTLAIKKKEKMLVIEDSFASSKKEEIKTLNFHVPSDLNNLISITCKDRDQNQIEAKLEKGAHSLYYMQKQGHKNISFQLSEKENGFQTIVKFDC